MIKPLKKLVFFLCLFLYSLTSFAQKEVSQWFIAGSGQYYMDGTGPQQQPEPPLYVGGSNTSICDSNGNLLFFISAYNNYNSIIYDRNYKPLPYFSNPNIYLLAGYGNAFFVKKPGSNSQYYLFYTGNFENPVNHKVHYALLDLSLNNGYGDVIESNVLIDDQLSYGFTILHKTNEDFWILTHKRITKQFNTWEVTSSGIASKPVKSFSGLVADSSAYDFGELKASPNGKFVSGFATQYTNTSLTKSLRFVEVFQFNNTTGDVSNYIKTATQYGDYFPLSYMEYSPDNRLLYVMYNNFISPCHPTGYQSGSIVQYNLCYTDSILFNRYSIELANNYNLCNNSYWGAAQLATDKKIYTPYTDAFVMSSIQKPNVIGNSSAFTLYTPGWEVTNYTSGMPTFYHSYVEQTTKNNITYSGACYPSPITFRVANDTIASVKWNFGDPSSASNTSTLLQPSHQFSKPGIYTVTADLYTHDGNNIETISEIVEIKDPSGRLLYDFPKDTAMCEGDIIKVKLNVINGIFHWSYRGNNHSLEELATTDSLLVGEYGEGTYIVEMRQNDCDGCTMVDSIIIHKLRKPDVELGPDKSFCQGDSVQLITYNPGSVTTWNTGDTTPAIVVTKAGDYWVTSEYDHNRCIAKDTITVTENPSVIFRLPADTILCNNQKLVLYPDVNQSSYLWQDNSVIDSFVVSKPGKYWVRITNSFGCFASDTINVSYVSAASVNLGADTSLCKGDSLTLSLNIAGSSYYWSTGSNANNIIVKSDGSYWIKVDNDVCTVTDTILVSFKEPPALYLGNDTSLCDKETLLLNATTQSSVYTWQDGSVNASYTVAKPGQYFVKVNQQGCSTSDTINVYYKPLPFVYLGNDTSLCQNDYLLLNTQSAEISSYHWQDNSTKASYTIASAGNYIVNVTGINGCNNSDSITVLYNPLPYFSLGNDTTICEGEKLLLQLNFSNALYLWQDGTTANNFTVRNSGLYYITVQQNGCSQTDSIYVNYVNSPTITLGNDTTLCNGTKLVVSAYNQSATYNWQDNSAKPDYVITHPGIYKVEAAIGNCKASDDIEINYIDKPVFSLGLDSLLCSGQQIVLAAPENFDSYKWQDGSSARQFTVIEPGIYTLDVTNKCGTTRKEIIIVKTICTLNMPSAFTPNGDGNNDLFRVKYPSFIKEFHFVVYNRFGQKVFETKDAYKGWDGRFNGALQPPGTYVWFISLTDNDGKRNTGKGSVLLIN